MLATGYYAPVIAQGRSEEELEKRLGAALLAGDASVSIDNCARPLESSFLCMMLTQQQVKVRILGQSIQPELPCNAFVTATGNKLTLVGDLTRRSLRCSLDPKMERPELRRFDFDPVEMVRERRADLVAAALTLLRAYWVSGERVDVSPFGSFETWSRRVREALVWLGCADPCATVENVRADDPERAALAAVLAQMEKHLDLGVRYSASDIIQAATSMTPVRGGKSLVVRMRGEFKSSLFNVAGDGQNINSRRLGIWLAKNENKPVDGLQLRPQGLYDGIKHWALYAAPECRK